MATLVIFNPNTNRVIKFFPDGGFSPPDYGARTDCDFNANLSAVIANPQKYWKRSAGLWVMQTAPEQAQTDADEILARTTNLRAGAVSLIDTDDGISQRAIADMAISELNNIHQWIESFKAQVALATTLANLQTRVASLPAMPDRTLAQARTAYKNSVNNGNVDS